MAPCLLSTFHIPSGKSFSCSSEHRREQFLTRSSSLPSYPFDPGDVDEILLESFFEKTYISTINDAIKKFTNEVIMNAITANQLKTKGVSVIESNLTDMKELVITVRGKEKYVVMDMEHYNYLRECELDAALHETRTDYQNGKFVTESVEKHIQRITK